MNKYPVYIISKGRWESRLTVKALEKMNVPYYVVVEPQEYDKYAAVIHPDKILILPTHYLENYDTFNNVGANNGTGPGAARNFCWQHSIEAGAERHWVLDDNIRDFWLLNNNKKYRVNSDKAFSIMEDFVDRYENVALAGPQYFMFAPQKYKAKPFILNTRIYSCLLIENDIPFRWRGRYNEDTDLSLRALKAGYCTVEFYYILQQKMPTQTMKGGNTAEFYAKEGTYNKSKMLFDMHPDVTKLVFRYGRHHHYVDYRPFKKNRLRRKKDIIIPTGTNDYGLKLIKRCESDALTQGLSPVKELRSIAMQGKDQIRQAM